MSKRMKPLLFAFTTCIFSGCDTQPALTQHYEDAVAITIDCDDYGPGKYRINVRVTGNGSTDTDELALWCD